MYGEIFICSICKKEVLVGMVSHYNTDILPDLTFFNGVDSTYWVLKDDNLYCGNCSDIKFPENVIAYNEGKLNLTLTGTICY